MKDGWLALCTQPAQTLMAANRTVRLTISTESCSSVATQTALQQAAEVIRSGGTVAFPTETVYGLGANALNPAAVEKIFLAKQRPAWDPIIVHIADRDMLAKVAVRGAGNVQQKIDALMDQFWPGPLTILLPKQPAIPSTVTAGRELVGIRMPAHPVALGLINAANLPIAAPSANRFGHTSPTTAQHVLEDLDGRIDLVLDSGPAWCGVESTVIEVRDHETILYRPGAIPAEEIESIAGPVILYRSAAMGATPVTAAGILAVARCGHAPLCPQRPRHPAGCERARGKRHPAAMAECGAGAIEHGSESWRPVARRMALAGGI